MSKLDLDDLFDEADAMASEETPYPPDLPLPSNYDENTPHRLMEVRNDASNGSKEIRNKGRGWYARQTIEPGTVLLVEKPLGMVMRWEEDEAEFGDNDDEDMSLEDDEGQKKPSAAAASSDSSANNMESGEESEEDDDDGPTGSVGTALLTMRLAESIKLDPTLWTGISKAADGGSINVKSVGICNLYPQTEAEVQALPPWVCADPKVGLEMENCLSSLCSENADIDADTAQAIRLRLALIVRYNSLSVETCPELFVHPSPVGHSSLSGTALFQYASLFNHSSQPNVNRWAIGDVTFFVANCRVEAGAELTISYVEHEILCEDSGRRTAVLGMDFVDGDDDVNEGMGVAKGSAISDNDDDAPLMPVVDAEVQQELMEMVPEERLEAIEELLAQAEGRRKAPEDHDDVMDDHGDAGDGEHAASWFQCDAHQLQILRALTLDGLGRHEEAYPVWEQCVAFVDAKLPPLDETGVALRVQTALCAWAMANDDGRVARAHADRAMNDHDALFGGGPERFRRRYRRELELNLRPDCKKNKKRPVRGLKVMRKLFPIEN